MKRLILLVLVLSGCSYQYVGKQPRFTFVHDLTPVDRAKILADAAAAEQAAVDVVFHPK